MSMEIWDIEQVANYLGVPVNTLYQWRRSETEIGPLAYRIDRSIVWDAEDVRSYAAQKAGGTATTDRPETEAEPPFDQGTG